MRKTKSAAALFCAAGLLIAPVARADTLLHLSVTADVTAMPDELVAELTAEAQAASAGAAQATVNAMIGQALGSMKSVSTITASTTTYSVWHETDPKDIWHASQGMTLRARDGAALLALVGQLQQDGLAVGTLSWQLSPALAEKTYEQAMAKAVDKLTGRGRAAAALLHMTMHGFRSVTLGDDGSAAPRPMMRMMTMAAKAEAAPPPNAVSEAVTVSATVSGEARLETGE
jgi:predicted secreted protein